MDEIVVSLENICKTFSGVDVLRDVNLKLKKGEVHALVGENGAGKSTLMKILMGSYTRTSGDIVLSGKQMDFYNIDIAKENGVCMIPQELALVPALSVGENIMMGQKTGKNGFISINSIQKLAAKYLVELGFEIEAAARVDSLPIPHRQMVSIAKAYANNAKIIIMDEPTSSLSRDEVDDLMRVIESLRENGTTIIYISHLLDEIFRIADRITVLRDGKYIVTANTEDITQRELVSYMVGEDLLQTQTELTEEYALRKTYIRESTALEVKELRRKGGKANVSFQVRAGEVVGITGLVGSGKTELMSTILSRDKRESGEIFIYGKKAKITSPEMSYKYGIANVPEDRKLEGLVLIRDVMENTSLCPKFRREISRFGFINNKKERENCNKYIERMNTKVSGAGQKVVHLSGGNQQKVVISKALSTKPKILLMDEPTRGIDVGAKAAIYKLVRQLKEDGVAVVYFSSDVSEMSFVSDRILIMCEDAIVKEMPVEDASIKNMLNYMVGE